MLSFKKTFWPPHRTRFCDAGACRREGEGVSPAAAKLVDFGNGWSITSSMATWLGRLGPYHRAWPDLVGCTQAQVAAYARLKSVFESLLEGSAGSFRTHRRKAKAFPATFPLLVTFFIFILIHNWMGLLPGVGTIGWGHDVEGEFHITRHPWIRPFNSDFNGTIALPALVPFSVPGMDHHCSQIRRPKKS